MPVKSPEAQRFQSHAIFQMNFFDELRRKAPTRKKPLIAHSALTNHFHGLPIRSLRCIPREQKHYNSLQGTEEKL